MSALSGMFSSQVTVTGVMAKRVKSHVQEHCGNSVLVFEAALSRGLQAPEEAWGWECGVLSVTLVAAPFQLRCE